MEFGDPMGGFIRGRQARIAEQNAAFEMEQAKYKAEQAKGLRSLLQSGVDINSPEGISQIYSQSPDMGMDLMKQQGQNQRLQAEQQKWQQEAGYKQLEAVTNMTNSILDATANMPPDQAEQLSKQMQVTYRRQLRAMGLNGGNDDDPLMNLRELRTFATTAGSALLQARQAGNKAFQETSGRALAESQAPIGAETQYKEQAQTRRAEMGAEAQVAAAGRQARSQDINTEMKMADDFRTSSKEFVAVRDAYSRLKSTLPMAHNNAPATLASATVFMKMLDPGSVVRESELGMALQSTGKLDQFANYFNTIQSGKNLTQQQVKNMGEIADQIWSAAQQGQALREQQYTERAQRYGIEPRNIIENYSVRPGTRQQAAPQQQVRQRQKFNVGQTATNPQTGEKIRWNGAGWEKL